MIRRLGHFNSIKVRLEPYRPSGLPAILTEFQFHKGTIRTQAPRRALSFYTQFQFHKGTIRTVPHLVGTAWYLDFNSIKVRLELQQRKRANITMPISIP